VKAIGWARCTGERDGLRGQEKAKLFPEKPFALKGNKGNRHGHMQGGIIIESRVAEPWDALETKLPLNSERSGNRLLQRGEVAVGMRWRHSHGRVDGRRGSWTVWSSSRTRVVLATTPGETDARVANRIALHLVDGHLSSMTLDELDEATALARRDLDVSDLAETLEERSKLILSDIAREATDEDCGVVGISKLIHRLGSTIVSHRQLACPSLLGP